ncbi:restriction endonuclease subunit S, partial [Capnocytophaga sp. G2]|uniref:restriction endonuclease subunit S n=1 Tax=Capnocytophaga sp. G2 TaxID=3110695 RepID=UPI002B45EC62
MFKLSENIDPNKVFIVNRSELEGRIDPIFYASDLAKFNTNIFKSVLLKSIVKYFKSGFGAGKQEQTDAKNGIIQIRPTNIDENGFLKYDKNIYLPIDKNSIRIEVNDILFNNTNSQELVGKTAILKENKELTFSNHITIIRVRKEAILPDYLWIILNMYQRNRIFYSICTNWNNQSGIGLELLKKLKIPLPPLEIQQQIVDLYEKAYTEKQQKEAEAQRLLDSIDDYLLGELGITLPKEEEHLPQSTDKNSSYNLDNDNPLVKKGRLFLTNLSEVTGERIDPDYYSIYY